MHCLRSLGSRDRGFQSYSGHGCIVFVCMCAFFCVCATSWSPAQGVLTNV
jgi:hypothetical protein